MEKEKQQQATIPELLRQIGEMVARQPNAAQNLTRPSLEPSSSLANVIRRTRIEQKLSQKQLASLAGLSPLTVTKIENGNRRASFENVERILSTLGKSIWIR